MSTLRERLAQALHEGDEMSQIVAWSELPEDIREGWGICADALLPVVDDLVARALAEQREQIAEAVLRSPRLYTPDARKAADIVREVGKP